MGCTKVKNTCLDKYYATCVYYELDLPEISQLQDCVTLEETTQELYSFIEELKSELDFSQLETNCGDLTELSLKEILVAQQNKICELEQELGEQPNLLDTPLTDCDIDLQGLVDVCGEQPETVCDLLKIIVNQITQ